MGCTVLSVGVCLWVSPLVYERVILRRDAEGQGREMAEANAMLDGEMTGIGALLLVVGLFALVAIINGMADAKHRQNAQILRDGYGSWGAQANHTANGCTGVMIWIGLIIAVAVVFGGLSVGG